MKAKTTTHECLCNDKRALEHEVRKIAGALVTDRRAFLLKSYGAFVLEGKVTFTEHDGHLASLVGYSDVSAFLHHHFNEGQKVRIMVIPTDVEGLTIDDLKE